MHSFQLISHTLILALSLLISGCGSSDSTKPAAEAESVADTLSRNGSLAERAETSPCPIEGKMLPGNWILIRNENLLITIVADSVTRDADLGPSHRLLRIYDSRSCEKLEQHILPVNEAPDYPYQIAEITYNKQRKLVGIKGRTVFYVYDVANRKLLPRLQPEFASERYGVDAQSGMIQRLEVWENYLVGYAQDLGAFVFEITEGAQPRTVLPKAEYRSPVDRYVSLFLLPSDQEYQAFIPFYDRLTDEFDIRPLFRKPMPLYPDMTEQSQDGRFVILRLSDVAQTRAFAVDLKTQERIDIPPHLSNSDSATLFEWLRRES